MFCTPAESLALAPRYPVQTVVGRCSSADQSSLYAQFVRNETRVVPTLTVAYEVALWPTRNLPGEAFVLLREDPLLDIRHTRAIEAVIANGRLILP